MHARLGKPHVAAVIVDKRTQIRETRPPGKVCDPSDQKNLPHEFLESNLAGFEELWFLVAQNALGRQLDLGHLVAVRSSKRSARQQRRWQAQQHDSSNHTYASAATGSEDKSIQGLEPGNEAAC
jgi:hypothetical protein